MSSQQIKRIISQGNKLFMRIDKQIFPFNKQLKFISQQLNQKNIFIPCGCLSSKIAVDDSFKSAFSKLNEQGKAEYYRTYSTIVFNILNDIQKPNVTIKPETQNIQIYIMLQTDWKWRIRSIQIDNSNCVIKLTSTNKQINLQNYILRTSRNKQKNAIVLEPARQAQTGIRLRMSPFQEEFQSFLCKMKIIMEKSLKKHIISFLKKQQLLELQTIIYESDLAKNIIDTSLIVSNELSTNNKENKLKNITQKLENNFNFQQIRPNIYYDKKNQIMRKCFIFQQKIPCEWLIDNLVNKNAFFNWKKTLIQAKQLRSQEIGSKKYLELHRFSNLKLGCCIYNRTKYQYQNIVYFFDEQAQDVSGQMQPNRKFNYCIWKIDNNHKICQITVQIQINKSVINNQIFDLKQMDQYLGDFSLIIQDFRMQSLDDDLNINTRLFQENYLQKIQELDSVQELNDFYSIEQNQIQTDKCKNTFISNEFVQHQLAEDHYNLLNRKHLMTPLAKTLGILRLPINKESHPFWQGQWKINEKGEMLSINYEKVKAQNSVLKSVIKSIGKNIFNGKSILNLSLPVTIFGKDSTLSLICKSYSYAPFLLQQAAKMTHPADRMKYVIAFNISCAIAQIQMEKPFNPIIGQTFQCIIDGCPVYGEQISHHPPISATYMVGRGYKLHGQFESKVNMGLNSATGCNDGIMTIQFDDGSSLIKYRSFSGQMSGLVYGDRKLALVGINHYYDLINHIFVQLKFGRHKGVTQYSKYGDGVQGTILKIKNKNILNQFWNIKFDKPEEVFGIISGRWTQQLYFEDQPIFNSWKNYPHEIAKQKTPLESDSFKRLDLIKRIELDYERSQQQKEHLQQAQRKDRKLREKYRNY